MVMFDNKKEVMHITSLLKNTQNALQKGDASTLQQLSEQTVHSASIQQHTDLILVAVLLYALNKIVLNKERMNIKRWNMFVKKFVAELEKSIASLQANDSEEFVRHLEHGKELLLNISPDLKSSVAEVLKKASINKAGKIYEHGISLPQTARLLDITQWELLEYIGHVSSHETPYGITVDEKKRARMAMEFLS